MTTLIQLFEEYNYPKIDINLLRTGFELLYSPDNYEISQLGGMGIGIVLKNTTLIDKTIYPLNFRYLKYYYQF